MISYIIHEIALLEKRSDSNNAIQVKIGIKKQDFLHKIGSNPVS
ncbi:conserved hypothetical protein [Listeria monocytogenes]|nr:uncharacterized protein LMKH_1523 [Listeria monocytogenes]EAL08919.1 hypothetical protein LMOh7858_1564 [Listeria monocytogenes str. 4b H7858] [Listeria monocytogenes serotype 4b str. H7858]EEW18000.1 conserved hypothetical protein [Listeria monocytogenes FSL R2-503]EFG01472.1 conserved hypothetical protein [Listeria monocytogenes FSL J1-194]EGJ25004.1 hypothetical protein LMOSA_23890 [Listeria monocytogenes str. Scott A]EXL18326.1 hypothetical protein X845_0748 [Listeria monocytogenes Lm_1